MNKNENKLKDFITYCHEHPEQRFWQALRNWSGYSYIWGEKADTDGQVEDTFYL